MKKQIQRRDAKNAKNEQRQTTFLINFNFIVAAGIAEMKSVVRPRLTYFSAFFASLRFSLQAGCSPSFSNSASSRAVSGLPVVSSFSP
jgi:hypothetical protein